MFSLDVPSAFGLAVSFWKGLGCMCSVSGLEAFDLTEKLKVVTGACFWGECLGFYYLQKTNDVTCRNAVYFNLAYSMEKNFYKIHNLAFTSS